MGDFFYNQICARRPLDHFVDQKRGLIGQTAQRKSTSRRVSDVLMQISPKTDKATSPSFLHSDFRPLIHQRLHLVFEAGVFAAERGDFIRLCGFKLPRQFAQPRFVIDDGGL
jgi:hypothetical protein